MSRKVLISEIGYLIEIIGEQHVTISGHETRIPRIELDLMMENVRRLYDCLYHMNKINDMAGHPDENIEEKDQHHEEAEEGNDLMEPKPETEFIFPGSVAETHETQAEIGQEPSSVAAYPQREEYLPETPVQIIREEKKHPSAENAITLDLFTSPATVADKFREKSPVMASKIQNHKITDLKTAIGINDKFLFINDLFDGNMKAYSVAIDSLNGMNSFGEAENYIEKIKTDGNRVRNLETIARLTELVKRRYL